MLSNAIGKESVWEVDGFRLAAAETGLSMARRMAFASFARSATARFFSARDCFLPPDLPGSAMAR